MQILAEIKVEGTQLYLVDLNGGGAKDRGWVNGSYLIDFAEYEVEVAAESDPEVEITAEAVVHGHAQHHHGEGRT